MRLENERHLAGVAEALLAPAEQTPSRQLAEVRKEIAAGGDPLGTAFCQLRSPEERRPQGATYTPIPIVDSMVAWASKVADPERIVDPGTGSGRFLVAAGRAFPKARLVGVELDPLAALVARANLAACGLTKRAEIVVGDYRAVRLPASRGQTLFLGNPPYVRHHDISRRWKTWLTEKAAARGIPASQLAGLHVHFFLATLEHAVAGDVGCFITAGEWLDVNYGSVLRRLFTADLGGLALHLVEPTAQPFPDAETTAAITCFQVGSRPANVRVRRVARLADLGDLSEGRVMPASDLAKSDRWTALTRTPRTGRPGFVELGELCRVKRGQVTGANGVWIANVDTPPLPSSVLFPTVTKARELLGAGLFLDAEAPLRRVIDIPADLDELSRSDRRLVEAFLRRIATTGVAKGWIASHRRAWWSVGLYEPAPILATYMARRPPAFVRNLAAARHINIAHGLYPRVRMTNAQLDALARHLSRSVDTSDGRTYAGGLTKFEPKEMERLLVPTPEVLRTFA